MTKTQNLANVYDDWKRSVKMFKFHLATVKYHYEKLEEDLRLDLSAPPLDQDISQSLGCYVGFVSLRPPPISPLILFPVDSTVSAHYADESYKFSLVTGLADRRNHKGISIEKARIIDTAFQEYTVCRRCDVVGCI